MSYNQQWPGHGKEDMAQSLRVLVENTPQIPFGKIVKFVKRNIRRIILWMVSKRKRRDAKPIIASYKQKSMSIENN